MSPTCKAFTSWHLAACRSPHTAYSSLPAHTDAPPHPTTSRSCASHLTHANLLDQGSLRGQWSRICP
ncbi:hypothetical protein K439DRAFT_1627196 [Ramaria rubella]|nr:hypothetical protein K439DRAFT_1627196 [Ramaria rubella]